MSLFSSMFTVNSFNRRFFEVLVYGLMYEQKTTDGMYISGGALTRDDL